MSVPGYLIFQASWHRLLWLSMNITYYYNLLVASVLSSLIIVVLFCTYAQFSCLFSYRRICTYNGYWLSHNYSKLQLQGYVHVLWTHFHTSRVLLANVLHVAWQDQTLKSLCSLPKWLGDPAYCMCSCTAGKQLWSHRLICFWVSIHGLVEKWKWQYA